MRINNMNIVSGILCVLSFLLAVSITFTDMFWYLPGFFVMLLSVVSSVVGLMSSSKVFNGITLFLTIIFFLIFSSPLLLA
ncbi:MULTISPECIES: hypothetical protein [Staphylococcus]|jgi:hypothetical protein|uniref:Uncharacterized protein n=2 Tax=Staphylococcus TaxID=1279 RepID=A0A4Q9WRJ4_STAHO|nr:MULTISPECIES: hypothetical protein [Staphylococcus]EUZ68062.1 hypothetical protein O552_01645 [Staphylococcus sp. M0480]OFK81624.1 hypothetical protein HMPREF2799_08900 [Staphylococcus sp. HMSC057A02]OFM60206.1 hypothetical protein HMPREF2673_06890 [Staphylococcus sp. HMSC062C01]OFM60438.1 hypothetical protein HMPREF2677_05780 [Staphylococcus sp. HMSC059G05]OFM73890.1 hypothetical protein HMPREF2662_03960 [Staphylococcus sp. HMSC074B09]OFM92640.1 hypothetical protein HMPREF2639_05615 [Stap